MNEGETVSVHSGKFKSIISQLSKVDITFSDEVKALRLLSLLPTSWDTAVMSISNSAGNEKLKLENVTAMILGEEDRRLERGYTASSSSSGSALNMQ
ncbi:hypothetical protein BVC80_8981g3 [Macleaya cordata]|uniref:UBN2 domain-containing protein n=1 Tax=Macleaya cordata TaxID=56857 RepID=A0A200Q7A2_MACCD|nr:hypothetical protein BVC80_8981g3 [Macleaya cordata]